MKRYQPYQRSLRALKREMYKPRGVPKTPKQWLNDIKEFLKEDESQWEIRIRKCVNNDRFDDIEYIKNPNEEISKEILDKILLHLESPDFESLMIKRGFLINFQINYTDISTFQDLRSLLNLPIPRSYKKCEETMNNITKMLNKYRNSKCLSIKNNLSKLEEKYQKVVQACLGK